MKKFWDKEQETVKRKFYVQIYYSTFYTQIVEADNEQEAVNIARKKAPDYEELLSNLEPWEDADTLEEII